MIFEKVVRSIANKLGITTNILDFRRDMLLITSDSIDLATGRDPHVVKREIREAHRDATHSAFSDLALIIGIISFVLGLFITEMLSFEIIGIIFSAIGLLRASTVGIMAYEMPVERRPVPELEFMRAWNLGPVSKYSNSIFLPIIAIVMGISEKGYQIGLKVIEDWIDDHS